MTPRSRAPATRRRRSTDSGIRSTIDNVIGALRGEGQADTDGREGLRSLELLIGMYLSARDGRPVGLPLEL